MSLVIGHWSFVICHLSLVICHLSLVIGHLSFVIGHLSLVKVLSLFTFRNILNFFRTNVLISCPLDYLGLAEKVSKTNLKATQLATWLFRAQVSNLPSDANSWRRYANGGLRQR
ncbi:hypothetical protein LC605_24770 [Nostoc sp. CHAB 5836]|nr:hypothetical protein [Nostoc sp. CHAB 5836]